MEANEKDEKTYQFVVYGRVQAVGFRMFVNSIAKSMGVKGFVQNQPDGTVLVIANLNESNFQQFLQELQKGSMFSRVTKIEHEEIPYRSFYDFEIR